MVSILANESSASFCSVTWSMTSACSPITAYIVGLNCLMVTRGGRSNCFRLVRDATSQPTPPLVVRMTRTDSGKSGMAECGSSIHKSIWPDCAAFRHSDSALALLGHGVNGLLPLNHAKLILGWLWR